MTIDRLLPTDEGAELVSLVSEIARPSWPRGPRLRRPPGSFPATPSPCSGEVGVLGLPYPEEYGGSGQPYEVYLQALEEIAAAWMTVGVGVSVHVMASYAMAGYGTAAQRATYLPEMVGGRLLGAYALSEPQAGFGHLRHDQPGQAGGRRLRAERDQGVDHPRRARRLLHHLRPQRRQRREQISCFHVPGHAPGLSFGAPERKMGLTASPTTSLYFDAVHLDDDR